jgi:ribosomal protein S16
MAGGFCFVVIDAGDNPDGRFIEMIGYTALTPEPETSRV